MADGVDSVGLNPSVALRAVGFMRRSTSDDAVTNGSSTPTVSRLVMPISRRRGVVRIRFLSCTTIRPSDALKSGMPASARTPDSTAERFSSCAGPSESVVKFTPSGSREPSLRPGVPLPYRSKYRVQSLSAPMRNAPLGSTRASSTAPTDWALAIPGAEIASPGMAMISVASSAVRRELVCIGCAAR